MTHTTQHLYLITFRAADKQGTVTHPFMDTDLKSVAKHCTMMGYGEPLSIQLVY